MTMSGRRRGGTAILLATLALLPAAAVAQQSRAEQLQQQFDHETDSVKKAKLLIKFGDAEFDEIRKQVEQGNIEMAANLLGRYRDDCRAAQKSLDSTGVNPESHPAGYKELQMSVRAGLRRLSDILAGLTADNQKRFESARGDLETLNRALLRQLFPRQPGTAHADKEHP